MDLMAIGKFIAALRKEKGLTQEQLGEKLGVSNKTISRWETGVYLPPADALLAMGEFFAVSVNEILTGKRLSDQEYKQAAEANLTQAIQSSFSWQDKRTYFEQKWQKDHLALLILLAVGVLAVLVLGLVYEDTILLGLSPFLAVLVYAWQNNAKMAYVEHRVFDQQEKSL